MSFAAAFAALMGNEGGYSNNPLDPGGETMWGVTERVARRHGYQGAMIDLPQSVAMTIAKTEYWDPTQCDQFDPAIAFQLFDTAYNGGHPALWLQQAAGVAQDGIIGPNTIGAVRACNPQTLVLRFCAYRLIYLTGLPTWPTFGRGWSRRIANNMIKGAEQWT